MKKFSSLYFSRFICEIKRFIKLGIISPHALIIFTIIRLTQIMGGRYEKIMPENHDRNRTEKISQKQSLGWVDGARIYKLKIGPLNLANFIVNDLKTLHILNFYYLRNASFILRDLKNLKKLGANTTLKKDMNVFEPGCNMGKMLFLLKDFFNVNIFGADIYDPSIQMVRKIKTKKDIFRSEDVLASKWLSGIPDNYFNLAIASSFINHVSHLPSYHLFLKELKRTAQKIYIHDRALDDPAALAILEEPDMKITRLKRGQELVFFAEKI